MVRKNDDTSTCSKSSVTLCSEARVQPQVGASWPGKVVKGVTNESILRCSLRCPEVLSANGVSELVSDRELAQTGAAQQLKLFR